MNKRAKTVDVKSRFVKRLLQNFWFALFAHWVFQGLLYMDKTERAFKISIDLFVMSIYVFAFGLSFETILVGLMFGHTLNFVFNGQINVVLKNFGLIRNDERKLKCYLASLQVRIRLRKSVCFGAVYGSLSRSELRDTSDLDIRLVRNKGLIYALDACLFVAMERTRAFMSGIPLDIYVCDSRLTVRGLNPKEIANAFVLKAEKGYLEENKTVVVPYMVDMTSPNMGGGIRYVTNIIEGVGRVKRDVRFTVLGVKTEKHGRGTVPFNVDFIPLLKESNFVAYLGSLSFYLLRNPLPSGQIVHIHRTYFAIPFLLLSMNPRLVFTLHSKSFEFVKIHYPKYFHLIRFFYSPLEYLILQCAKHIICVNEVIRDSYQTDYPKLRDKFHVIPTAVDIQPFINASAAISKETNPTIIFLGRFSKEKNLPLLLNAMAIINRHEPTWGLHIGGTGDEKTVNSCRDLCEKIGISENVKFFGEILPLDVPQFLASGHLLALPSLFEGSPTVVREALAVGIPFVSTDVGDIKEILNHSLNAKLIGRITRTDEKDFATGLLEMMRLSIEHRYRVSNLTQELSQQFSLETITQRIFETIMPEDAG